MTFIGQIWKLEGKRCPGNFESVFTRYYVDSKFNVDYYFIIKHNPIQLDDWVMDFCGMAKSFWAPKIRTLSTLCKVARTQEGISRSQSDPPATIKTLNGCLTTKVAWIGQKTPTKVRNALYSCRCACCCLPCYWLLASWCCRRRRYQAPCLPDWDHQSVREHWQNLRHDPRSGIAQQEMRNGTEVTRHQNLGLGHEPRVWGRHSLVRPTLGVCEVGDCGVAMVRGGREE